MNIQTKYEESYEDIEISRDIYCEDIDTALSMVEKYLRQYTENIKIKLTVDTLQRDQIQNLITRLIRILRKCMNYKNIYVYVHVGDNETHTRFIKIPSPEESSIDHIQARNTQNPQIQIVLCNRENCSTNSTSTTEQIEMPTIYILQSHNNRWIIKCT
ncbi:MAG: hypothetical protein NZZ41_07060 [Candidatus Dojkabacteria bacterium]|nr:hypothetical protein [Candidatus Dojkabacteria bacterium]